MAARPRSPWRARLLFYLGLAALLLLSLGLRLLFLSGIDARETFKADAAHYVMLAYNLAARGAYSTSVMPPVQPHVRWPPGYPLLLAPFFAGVPMPSTPAFWRAIERAMTTQVLVGATLPLLVVVLAGRIMPPAAAWAAGLLSACCPMLAATCAFLVTEIPFTVLLLLTLTALSRQLERPTPLGAAVAGLLCGYLVLMRSFAPTLVVVAAAHLAVRG